MTKAATSELPAAPMRSIWRRPMVWLGFGLSGLAIATFVTLFDMTQVSRTLLRVSVWHVLLSAAIFLSTFVLRSLRWQVLLVPLARLPFGKVRDALLIGYMVNLLLPARMGELARALTLWKTTGTSRRGALTSVALDRLMDAWMLLGLMAVLGLVVELPPWTRQLTRVFILVMGGILGVVIWLAFHERSFFFLMERALFFLPSAMRDRVVRFFQRFAVGSHALRRPGLIAGGLAATAGVWFLEYFIYFTMMKGFAIDLPAWTALLALLVTNIGKAAAPVPGAIGVFEAACSGALIAVGVDRDLALSYAIAIHLMMYVSLVIVGQYLMWKLGLKLADITQK